jgi:hypothetical protein
MKSHAHALRMRERDPEFRRAMAFEDDYILLGNKTQVISGLETLLLLRPPPEAGGSRRHGFCQLCLCRI